MEKKTIFSKINSRDYNNQLELILENKDFSENVKNLLLSMLYKIEEGYKDYTTVKRIVENKKIYIEEVLQIIKNKCNKIKIVGENSEESTEMKESNTKYLIDKIEGKIYLMYPNERLLLYTIYKMNDQQVYIEEKYNLIRNALSEILNVGKNMNDVEVIRDFNGWNWNTESKEIVDITTNLIFQNLVYLLGYNFLKEWIREEKVVDHVALLNEELIKLYGKKISTDILYNIYKLSIIICTRKNSREKERLLNEKEIIETQLEKLKDKKSLLNEASNTKKEYLKEIKKIDTILIDRELLQEEFIKRNEKRKEYKKIFNITHLTEILNKERKKFLTKIEESNRLLEPNYYVKIKQELEIELKFLEEIELEANEQEKRIQLYLINLQSAFIKCLKTKIESANEKEELINYIYILRYYNYIFFSKKLQIKDVKELQEEKSKIEELLIEKACELKVLNRIASEKKVNFEIIKSAILTRIINIDNINIELNKNDNLLEVNVYDGSTYEKTIVIPTFDDTEILVKYNKTIKIFS